MANKQYEMLIERTSALVGGSAIVSTSDKSDKAGIRWDHLNQHHECYDAERITKLNLLLHGDAASGNNAKHFLTKLAAEFDAAYADRLTFATYENNFGEIINDYGSTLFSKPLAVHPAVDAEDEDTPGDEPDDSEPYMQFQRHFTLDDQSMPDFMHCIQTESNALSYSYFGIDFEDDGSTPYAYYIDPLSVLDWEKDEEGKFIFLVLRNDESIRLSANQVRDEITTTFSVWKNKDGKITLDQYQIKYPKNTPPKSDDIVKHYAEGSRSDLSFKQVPIVECETPDNISIGKLIGQMAGSLFARYSTYLFCLNRGINPLLVYKQGAELPANGDLSSVNEDDDRGNTALKRSIAEGKAVIGPTDELGWESPDSKAYTVVQTQLEKDKNEMYRLCASLNSIIGHTGFSTAQTKASGISKLIDNMNKEHMLQAYAKLVKEWVLEAFQVAFDALQLDVETKSDVVWQCKGMDNYRIVDEDQLMAKITALPIYKQNMPSVTSYKQYVSDIAYDAHPFSNIGTMDKIMKEIADNIDKQDLDTVHQNANPEGAIAADSAKQLDKAVPQQKVAGKPAPKVNSPGGSDIATSQPREVGESGQAALQPGSHLQTGSNIEWQVVYDALKKDYAEADIQFVKMMSWTGPVEVDISDIDMSGEEEWAANKEGKNGLDKVEKYTDIMKDKGFQAFNPVILTNTPNNDQKYYVVDGRHRIKAAEAANAPIMAYIGSTGSNEKDMPHIQLHDKQLKGDS